MRFCRFTSTGETVRIGMAADDAHLFDLTAAGIGRLSAVLDSDDPLAVLSGIDTVQPNGSFTVVNERNKHTKTYRARR